MASFETVVRPAILPDIRPRARQSLPPQNDPTKGFAKIFGQPAKQVTMTYSMSVSSSHSKPKEVERRVDEVRVYQKEDDGKGGQTVNKKNYVDLLVVNKLKMNEPLNGMPPGAPPAVPPDEGGPGSLPEGTKSGEIKEYFYERVRQQEENIEVKRRDVIMRNGEEFKG